ncbi:hypothetical protein Mal15_07890 [Stieleria maiorica]|uniref:DUF2760 domain-containing protein n=1 Tax=Stieleria maiorica TaxID=2795974 RepID=A0A5B9M7R8_9BACT|nr:DUF2760 domain-containing protein [Stieleria maiorica]QEF96759.1 hypothetical protein Mal15_07890 [Stieleria maiorica]
MSIGIALKAFFAALGNKDKATQIDRILRGQPSDVAAIEAKPQEQPAAVPVTRQPVTKQPEPPPRDSAVTLLATLQREARLVDLIQEDLSQYSDAQVGAAARPCLQQCGGVLQRVMGLKPLLDAAEGATVDVAPDASPTRYQWIGEGTATSGKLVHHGWQATQVELPTWTGDSADANVVAPAQVQAG